MSKCWEEIEKMFLQSLNKIELKKSLKDNKNAVDKLNINEESVLGAMIVHTSGVIVNGYLRILGKDGELDIILLNEIVKHFYPGNKLIVAIDIWGGIFAIGNNDFESDKRHIWYFAPDLLKWENLEVNYAEFIAWSCSSAISEFYKSFLWNDFETIIKDVGEKQAVLFYPFLWANECNVETANKEIVSFEEIIGVNAKFKDEIYEK